MRESQLFTRVERNFPKDEVSLNAKLLTRGGFINKLSSGIYAYLPLGWRVVQNISNIIREEMKTIGGVELQMSALVEKKFMEKTKRWDIPVGFRIAEENYVLGWTHEEVITALATKFIGSYKDLPFSAYQIQSKFRNEPRPQGGLLRTKEFLMKDLYSFHASEDDFWGYYEKAKKAYQKVFERCGLTAIYTLAGGGDFTMANTHEFQVVADVGEDTIFVCGKCGHAENAEISRLKESAKCPECGGTVKQERSIEVGNIFPLGTKYSEALSLSFKDAQGESKPVFMGSYGIGIGRVMGTVVEVHHDEKGIVWPESVAPFKVHLLELPGVSADSCYKDLQKQGIEVLYDEREVSPGEKLAEADIIGIPWRAVVSEKTKGKIELKKRNEKEGKLVKLDELVKILNPKS